LSQSLSQMLIAQSQQEMMGFRKKNKLDLSGLSPEQVADLHFPMIFMTIGWYFMKKWLSEFAYKTNLNWWIFALAEVASLAVAVLTVSWQSWRAASKNPVKSLRYE